MKLNVVWQEFLLAVVLCVPPANAQSGPTTGLYQIISGRYTACCGFIGIPISSSLPFANQQFIELTVDPQTSLAQMRFLGQDTQTVFRVIPCGVGSGFTYSLSNGMVFPDRIRFAYRLQPTPMPGGPYLSYAVSNSAGALRIDGVVVTESAGCADDSTHFMHSNVVAVLTPVTFPVIDQIERDAHSLRFHFNGEPPNDYTVEYSQSLAGSNWLPLVTHRAKIQTIDVVVTNSFTNVPARFFRVRKEPCFCR